MFRLIVLDVCIWSIFTNVTVIIDEGPRNFIKTIAWIEISNLIYVTLYEESPFYI